MVDTIGSSYLRYQDEAKTLRHHIHDLDVFGYLIRPRRRHV